MSPFDYIKEEEFSISSSIITEGFALAGLLFITVFGDDEDAEGGP